MSVGVNYNIRMCKYENVECPNFTHSHLTYHLPHNMMTTYIKYIYWKDDKEPTHVSEYVYSSEMDPSKRLCSVKDHQWERKSKVHIVIPVKNQGKWVIHVVKNLEDVSWELYRLNVHCRHTCVDHLVLM